MENSEENTNTNEYYTNQPQTGPVCNPTNYSEEVTGTNPARSDDKTNEDEENNEDEETQLADLLKKHKQLEEAAEEELQKQIEQHIEDCRNNLNIFSQWVDNKTNSESLYALFKKEFDDNYRSDLFCNICEFFNDPQFVTDDLLFSWKCMVVCLLKASKKYKGYLSDLVFVPKTKETNFRLVKEKYIFRCFIGEKHLCYFKENGNDYYVS